MEYLESIRILVNISLQILGFGVFPQLELMALVRVPRVHLYVLCFINVRIILVLVIGGDVSNGDEGNFDSFLYFPAPSRVKTS